MSRSYRQFCPLARALDRVGDRWTLLVVRDLVSGPKRYSDLLAGLPGIGTTLLGDRLRRLEDDGVVTRRVLPPPAASTVYELTDVGRELVTAIVPLAEWGLRYLDAIGDDDVSPEWVLMFWREHFPSDRAAGVRDLYELRVGKDVFHVQVDDGAMSGGVGPAPETPDVVVTTDWKTFVDVALGRIDPVAESSAGLGTVEGAEDAVARFFTMFTPRVIGNPPTAPSSGA